MKNTILQSALLTFLLMFTAGFLSTTHAQVQSSNFDDVDSWMNTQFGNSWYSVEIQAFTEGATQTVTLPHRYDGWEFEILGETGSDALAGDAFDFQSLSQTNNTHTENDGLMVSPFAPGSDVGRIRELRFRSDNELFDLESVEFAYTIGDLNAGPGVSTESAQAIWVRGYRNGAEEHAVEVSGQVTMSGWDWDEMAFSTISPAEFTNIDEVRIEVIPSGGSNSSSNFTDNISIRDIKASGAVVVSPPTVTTSSPTSITATGATISGNVTDDGGDTVTERGFVYATTSGPTTSDAKVQVGSGTGAFSTTISGLTAETTYYVHAYAINGEGTSYGSEQSFTTQSIFAGGDGTELDPYQVETAEQLDAVRDYPDSHFIQIADIDLGVSPWNEGNGWEPIAGECNMVIEGECYDSYEPFSGSYDGQGYKIQNLFINSGQLNIGLFSTLGVNGHLRNIGIEDASVTGGGRVGILAGYINGIVEQSYSTGTVNGPHGVGGLIGYSAFGSTISNSFSTASVTLTSNGGGGLTGVFQGDLIKNSYASGAIEGPNNNVGGLVGSFSGDEIRNSFYNEDTSGMEGGNGTSVTDLEMRIKSTFTNWDFDTVWQIDEPQNGSSTYPYLQNNKQDPAPGYEIVNLPVASNVSISETLTYDQELTGVYDFSDADGDTEGATTYQWYRFDDSNGLNKSSIIGANSTTYTLTKDDLGKYISFEVIPNDGTYDGNAAESTIQGPVVSPFAGGEGTQADPYQIATAEQLNYVRDFLDKHFEQTADIDLSGFDNWEPIGGDLNYGKDPFSGSFDGNGFTISKLTMNRTSYGPIGLFGNVNGFLQNVGVIDADITGSGRVGILVGFLSGDVKQSYSTGSVTGDNIVGGLIGYLEWGSSLSLSYTVSDVTFSSQAGGGLVGVMQGDDITNSFAVGTIQGPDNNKGGLVGQQDGNILNSFYNEDTSGQTDSKGIPLSTSEMKTKSTFTNAGWDFDTVWQIDEPGSGNISYPYLQNNTQDPVPGYFEVQSPEVVTNTNIENITSESATLSGEVTNDGGDPVTERGFVYSTSTAPTTTDSKVQSGEGTGVFSETISGLTSGESYYVRAYAINGQGTSYGSEESFTTLSKPEFTSTPITEVDYEQLYSYSMTATEVGDLATTISATTLPQWLTLSTDGQSEAGQIGNVPGGSGIIGVAGDDDGAVYAARSDGTSIYKIAPDGTTTEWATGLENGNVYALHVTGNYLYIPRLVQNTHSITRIALDNPEAGEEVFAAVSSGILSLTDRGDWIYAANYFENEIVRIHKSTKSVESVLTQSDGLLRPFGLDFDVDGNLYIATYGDRSILKYDGSSITTALSELPYHVTSIEQDESGSFYISMSSGGIRKYDSDWNDYSYVSPGERDNIWSISFTNTGALVYAIYGTNEVYRLQTGAILTGTPAKTDVGTHPVVLEASNSVGSTPQSFSIEVQDNVAPIVQSFSPETNATEVALQPNLSLTFDEEVVLGSEGILTINKGTTILRAYDLAVPEDRDALAISEDKLTLSFDLDNNLPVNTEITVGISAGFVEDHAGNEFEAFTPESNTWSFTTINKLDQNINFSEITAKTYGDDEFILGNEFTDQDLPVTYTAKDPDIVSISGNQAIILKAGTTEVTATQEGDDTRFAATPVTQTLTVGKAAITVSADAKSKTYGEEDPELTYQITAGALVGEDTFTGELTREAGENAGTYTIEQGTLSLSSNYDLSYSSSDLVIEKAEAIITSDATQTFTYDGTVKNVAATLNHSETELTYTPGQSYTDAGTYPVTISAEETDNYLSTSEEVSLVIENAEITGVDFVTDTFTYDGTEHSVFVTGLPTGATVAYDNNGQINAGTYTVTATVSQDNFNDKVLTADIVINKAEALITADAIQTFTYDGTVQQVAATLNHSEAVLTYVPEQGYTNAGTYDVTISAEETDNYLSASKEVSLVIENAEITGVDFVTDTFTYDGTEHSVFVTELPTGATVAYDNNGQINAGTYKVTATVSQENYNDKVLTAELIIDKAEALITADATQTFTYDGTVKNVVAALNHSETELTYAPAQGYTGAGSYDVTVSSAETSNYLSASTEVSLVIENAEITGVTFEGDTFIYDGTEHSIFVTGLPADATVNYANNGQTNAGTYTVTATVSQENYNDQVLTADLVINKAEALITADATQTFTYDGTVKNVVATLNHSETELAYIPQQGYTNAGTYDVTISAEETDNYLSASKEVSLVIENAEITGVTFENDTFTYDGAEKSIEVNGLPNGATVAYDNNGQINAGTYEVTATVSQENYNDQVLTADLVINKAEALITADAIQTFTYDGTVQNVEATLNHTKAELTYAPQQGYTDAGTYPVTISSEETENYLSTSNEVLLVIENAEIEGVAFEGKIFTYDGTSKSIEVSGLPEEASVSYEDNDQTNAGTYEVVATISQENYNDKVLTADLVINKAEALITADATQTFTYDGTVKEVTAALNHSETELVYAPAQGFTNAGTYDVTISVEETDNYLPTSKEVSLVIENAQITGVTFDGNMEPFTFDGGEHSIFVDGLPEGATVKYANNGQTNAGTYTVTAIVSLEGYEDLVLTTRLVINKASQRITFDELEDRNQQTDEHVQLNGTSTSGLPVLYSYTYETENPAATVGPRGFVRILGGGQVTITATQEGNQNYQAADPVERTLTINGSEARLNTAVINGVTYSNPAEDIYYLIGCGNAEQEVQIQLEQNQGSSIDQNNSFTMSTPAPGIYRETLTVTSEDGTSSQTYNIIVEKNFNFEDIVIQKFNNVMLVNNNPETNGGYKFVSYRWYKDGSVIGNGQYFSAGKNTDDLLDADSSYYVVLETEDGEILKTCTSEIQLRSSLNVSLAPNPVSSGGTMELLADFPKEELATMQLSIHNLNGMLLKQMKSNRKVTSISLPYNLQMGVYILKIETENISRSLRFIIR